MLLDSNIIIYAAQPEHAELRTFIAENDVVVSAVRFVEVLGYHKLTEDERATLTAFFAASEILPITQGVLERAVQLRQARKMSLVHGLSGCVCFLVVQASRLLKFRQAGRLHHKPDSLYRTVNRRRPRCRNGRRLRPHARHAEREGLWLD